MLLFIVCVIILYLLSLFSKGGVSFNKEKVVPLKAILALLIVLHHISLETSVKWLQPFNSWGAPIVSIFFFISGYGLMVSYNNKGDGYLNGFVKRRIIVTLLLPFLLALLLYRSVAIDLPGAIESICLLLKNGIVTLPHSWYVFAIFVLYIAFYLSCKVAKGKKSLFLLILLCAVYIIVTKHQGYARCWYISILAFPAGVIYAYYSRHFITQIYKYTRWIVPVCLLLAAVFYLLKSELGYMLVYVFIPLIIIYLCSTLNVEQLSRIGGIRWLSEISYEIYLCQGIAICLLEKFAIEMIPCIYIISVYLLTILLAYVVHQTKIYITNKLFDQTA